MNIELYKEIVNVIHLLLTQKEENLQCSKLEILILFNDKYMFYLIIILLAFRKFIK